MVKQAFLFTILICSNLFAVKVYKFSNGNYLEFHLPNQAFFFTKEKKYQPFRDLHGTGIGLAGNIAFYPDENVTQEPMTSFIMDGLLHAVHQDGIIACVRNGVIPARKDGLAEGLYDSFFIKKGLKVIVHSYKYEHKINGEEGFTLLMLSDGRYAGFSYATDVNFSRRDKKCKIKLGDLGTFSVNITPDHLKLGQKNNDLTYSWVFLKKDFKPTGPSEQGQVAQAIRKTSQAQIKQPKTINKSQTFSNGKEKADENRSPISIVFTHNHKKSGVNFKISSFKKNIKLPTLASEVGFNLDGNGLYRNQLIKHAGKTYLIISLDYTELEGQHNGGETFFIREDGVYLRYDYSYFDPKEVTIEDGIAKFPDQSREIDLNAFEFEAHFNPQVLPQQLFNGEGEEVEYPLEEANKHFPPIALNKKPFQVDPEELSDLRIGLGREEAGSVVVVGDAGTGKTELIKAFSDQIKKGKFLEIPRTTQVLQMSTLGVSQGSKYIGTLEARVQALLYAAKYRPTIVFMDEIHSLRGMGTHEGNSNDVFQFIKTPLADGVLKIIGTTTMEEYNSHFAGDPALSRRFTLVEKQEMSQKKIISGMKNWIKKYGYPAQSQEHLRKILELSSEWNAIGAQPAKSTSLLDYTFSFARQRGESILTNELIDEAAQRMYRIDPGFYFQETRFKTLRLLPEKLNEYIVGHSLYKRVLIELANQFFTGVHEHYRPAIRVLVAGPPGVGKSETAKVYAQELGLPITIIEMTRFAVSPPEHFLSELAAVLRKNPYGVILLDEIEKANFTVQNALLGVLNDGVFSVNEFINTSSKGGARVVKVNARNATFIATTNAGSEVVEALTSAGFGFGQNMDEEKTRGPLTSMQLKNLKDNIVLDNLSRPLLDRFQAVVPVFHPTSAEFADVIGLHLDKALKEMGLPMMKERDAFIHYLVKQYFHEGMSNRISQQIIQDHVRVVVAEALLNGTPRKKIQLQYIESEERLVSSCASAIVASESSN